MVLIIVTGILTGGAIPIFALIGYGISLILGLFFNISWGYWSCAAVGFFFGCLPGIQLTSVILRRKK